VRISLHSTALFNLPSSCSDIFLLTDEVFSSGEDICNHQLAQQFL